MGDLISLVACFELVVVEKMMQHVNWKIFSAWHMQDLLASYGCFTNLNAFVHSSFLRERSSIISILYMGSRRSKVAILDILKKTLQ